MNANIRQAEDDRAAIVAKVSESPKSFLLEPLRAADAIYTDGSWSVAVLARDCSAYLPAGIPLPTIIRAGTFPAQPTYELRIVSRAAEEALIGVVCCNGRGGTLSPEALRARSVLFCCIGIANYTLGLILLKPAKKEREPFVHRIGEMGASADKVYYTLPAHNVPSLTPHSRSVNALRDCASRLVAYREKLLRSTYTRERLEIIDEMRTIILAYSSYPHPT